MSQADDRNFGSRARAALATWSIAAWCIVGCVPHGEPVAGETGAVLRTDTDSAELDANVETVDTPELHLDSGFMLGSWGLPACGPEARKAIDQGLPQTKGWDGCGASGSFSLAEILEPLDIDCGGHTLGSCSWVWYPFAQPDWHDWSTPEPEQSDWLLRIRKSDSTIVELRPNAGLWVIPVRHGAAGGDHTRIYLSVGDPDLQDQKVVKARYRLSIRGRFHCGGSLDTGNLVSTLSARSRWVQIYLRFGKATQQWSDSHPYPTPAGFSHTAMVPQHFMVFECNHIVDVHFSFRSQDGKVWGEHIGKALIAWEDELP